jgi:hypothetical protein
MRPHAKQEKWPKLKSTLTSQKTSLVPDQTLPVLRPLLGANSTKNLTLVNKKLPSHLLIRSTSPRARKSGKLNLDPVLQTNLDIKETVEELLVLLADLVSRLMPSVPRIRFLKLLGIDFCKK